MSLRRDPRLEPPHWHPEDTLAWRGRALRWFVLVNVPLAVWYLSWLLSPGRASNRLLYAMLLGAEGLNVIQALGFWWTMASVRRRNVRPPCTDPVDVDVFIPVYNEPVAIVEATIAAATRLRSARARVTLLDDGGSPEMEALARRHGVEYANRPDNDGAKAGNINWSLARTDAPFVAILDCDHVPDPRFLEVTLAYFDDKVAFVQTPQYYANGQDEGVAGSSWSQQALFFGPIAVGRDNLGAMFCCGTNVVFRRSALEAMGGFPTNSLTEDFELSIKLHEAGWESRYVPEVLAAGIGPEDMGSYSAQQLRWARGCLSSVPRILTARLPLRLRLNYLLSAAHWLTGWTLLIYMIFPVVRILTGAQPLEVASADQFLFYWLPYFAGGMMTVNLVSGGCYRFSAYALMAANFWVHIVATVLTVLRRKGKFVVTPKEGVTGRQIRPVAAPLAAFAILAGVSLFGLIRDQTPATLNNVAFASVHMTVMLAGAWPALRRGAAASSPGVENADMGGVPLTAADTDGSPAVETTP